MNSLNTYGALLARVFMAAIFIIAGLGKLGDVQGFAGYMASGGVPAFLAWPVILFEILGGLALLLGFQTFIVALALAGFSLLSGLLYHFVPADQMQMTIFFKNVAMAGGYIAIALLGAGPLSIDAKRGK
ncbi:DoxX family protein [Marivivens sp. LCG002]|uniref:DoxX family protein n=1 Tax=Marivivens sp. LCG002 TaxID=3051171 RepID=UPI002555C3FF|nr:DoxX family protein [Marivivens sp. LCG002]WIV52021.1 DoxX family protein [Marivivens sp. LCG002]